MKEATVSILTHAQPDLATIDAAIAILGANLAALQDMARSLPVSVTISLDKRTEFCRRAAIVDSQFERVAVMMEAAGVES
jgi:hypothetical protein